MSPRRALVRPGPQERRLRHWHRLTPDKRATVCELLGREPALERGPLRDFPETPLCPTCFPEGRA